MFVSETNDNHKIYYKGKYWNDYSECLSIINKRLFNEDIDWITYLKKNNLMNFEHALILNCGNGWVERELYDKGIIKKATCVEYSLDLVNQCNDNKKNRNLTYICHDMNTIDFEENIFDVVINFAACHHIRYIEKVCINILKWLKKDGYFIHNDYIGPQRNQYTSSQWEEMNRINNRLNEKIKKKLRYPHVKTMMIDDPTEAINSGEIIPTINALFTVISHTKSGGAVAYEILTHNDNLYNHNKNEREQLVKMIMKEDMEYMEKNGESFFHFIISQNNKKIENHTIENLLNKMERRELLADKSLGHYSYNYLEFDKELFLFNSSYIESILIEGFYDQEQDYGTWSKGNKSIVRFKFDEYENKVLQIYVNNIYDINFNIEVNGQKTTNYNFINNNQNKIIEIDLIEKDSLLIFNYENVQSPKKLGLSNDDRKLGLLFRCMRVVDKNYGKKNVWEPNLTVLKGRKNKKNYIISLFIMFFLIRFIINKK